MFRCLSTWMPRIPYLRHSRRRIVTSCRARFLEMAMQRWLMAGLTLNSRASQFCFTSILRTGPEPDSCHLGCGALKWLGSLLTARASVVEGSLSSGPVTKVRSSIYCCFVNLRHDLPPMDMIESLCLLLFQKLKLNTFFLAGASVEVESLRLPSLVVMYELQSCHSADSRLCSDPTLEDLLNQDDFFFFITT